MLRLTDTWHFANAWGLSKEQLETILSQPHSLRRLLTRKFHSPVEKDADHKRHIALELASLISDHLTSQGGKFIDVYFALKLYMKEYKKYREQLDGDIQEWNKQMEAIHAILAADMENERKGVIKPDTFTQEERAALIRLGEQYQIKESDKSYWFVVGILKAIGLTEEQACEKIYEYLISKGDVNGSKMACKFQ